jgi:hypothetical protein
VVNAGRVVPLLVAAQLPNETLKTIWDLADADVDGALTLREFTVAMYLTERAASGTAPPDKLSDVPRATFAVLGDAGADAAAKAATAVAKEEEEKNRDAMFGSLMEPVVFSPTPVAAAAAAAAEEPRREPPRAAETSSSSREDAEPSTAPPPRFASPTLRLRTPATVDLSARKSRASEGGSAGGGEGKKPAAAKKLDQRYPTPATKRDSPSLRYHAPNQIDLSARRAASAEKMRVAEALGTRAPRALMRASAATTARVRRWEELEVRPPRTGSHTTALAW